MDLIHLVFELIWVPFGCLLGVIWGPLGPIGCQMGAKMMPRPAKMKRKIQVDLIHLVFELIWVPFGSHLGRIWVPIGSLVGANWVLNGGQMVP